MNTGIIFDLDGTLWEVIDATHSAVNEVATKNGFEPISRKTICDVFGTPREVCAKIYFPTLSVEEACKLMDESTIININNLQKSGGNVFNHVKETIEELSTKYKLFIVSNTAFNSYIEAFINCSGTNAYFTDYIATGEYNLTKSEAIKKIVVDHNLDKAIYIGDTEKDMEAAKGAGVEFIQAQYGFGKDLKTAHSIDKIEELPKKISIFDHLV